MSAASRPDPVRTCIGCRSHRPQRELVRITRTSAGIVVGGASSGRGAWLCGDQQAVVDGIDVVIDAACLERALVKRAFARAWRGDLSVDDEAHLRRLFAARRSTE